MDFKKINFIYFLRRHLLVKNSSLYRNYIYSLELTLQIAYLKKYVCFKNDNYNHQHQRT